MGWDSWCDGESVQPKAIVLKGRTLGSDRSNFAGESQAGNGATGGDSERYGSESLFATDCCCQSSGVGSTNSLYLIAFYSDKIFSWICVFLDQKCKLMPHHIARSASNDKETDHIVNDIMIWLLVWSMKGVCSPPLVSFASQAFRIDGWLDIVCRANPTHVWEVSRLDHRSFERELKISFQFWMLKLQLPKSASDKMFSHCLRKASSTWRVAGVNDKTATIETWRDKYMSCS